MRVLVLSTDDNDATIAQWMTNALGVPCDVVSLLTPTGPVPSVQVSKLMFDGMLCVCVCVCVCVSVCL